MERLNAPRLLAAILVVSALLAARGEARAAPPEITMFGASWCGPCRAVKQYLESNRVSFRYLDIDDPKNREAFKREGGGPIPHLLIGRDKIIGANLDRIRSTLERVGLMKAAPAAPGSPRDSFGGHSADWWQAQFRDLRGRILEAQQKIAAFSKVAADDQEKEILVKMRDDHQILQASLDQLESDASNVAVPRKFRE